MDVKETFNPATKKKLPRKIIELRIDSDFVTWKYFFLLTKKYN